LPLLLAVFRVLVQRRLAEASTRDSDELKPEVLDLALTRFVIREEVARDGDFRVGNRITRAKKLNEELDHRRVRVDEVDAIPPFRAFGPEQHAPGCV